MGERVQVELPDAVLDAIAERVTERVLARLEPESHRTEFVTIPEAAELLRTKRQRVDDLLSAGALARVKDGRRTLIRRADLDAYLRKERPS